MEIFVSGFLEDTTEEQLKRLFSSYGHVIGATVIRYSGGSSKGYGFVKMRDVTRGKFSVRNLNGSPLDGKELIVQRYRYEVLMKIRVMGFPPGTSKDHIQKLFSIVGTVTEVKKKKGKPAAYVIMPYEEQAKKAVKLLNGANLMGKKIIVEEYPS